MVPGDYWCGCGFGFGWMFCGMFVWDEMIDCGLIKE